MEEKIITLASYPNITEASIVQGRLEDQGIETYVVDANMQVEDAVPGPSFGAVKLHIRESDAPRAMDIISTSVAPDADNSTLL